MFVGELSWYVYGNTFIYSTDIQYCTGDHHSSIGAYQLWMSTLIIICYGYANMLYVVLVLCFATMLCCIYRSWSLEITQNESDRQTHGLNQLPVLDAMENYRIRRYESHRSHRQRNSVNSDQMSNKMSRYTVPLTFIDGTSCGLCLEEFKPKDTVLDCHTGHVFHERCFAR